MLGYAFSNPNLGEGLCIFTSFHFPDSILKLLNGSDFYFDLFWIAWHWKPAIGACGAFTAAPKRTGSDPGIVTVISLW